MPLGVEATCLHPNASTRARSQPQNTPGIAEATELRLQWEGTEAPERSSSTAPHRSHNRPAAWTPLCASAKPAQLDEPSMLSASCQGIPWTTGSHKTPRHPTACHQVRASGSGPRAPGPRVTEVWPPIWDPLASSPSTGGVPGLLPYPGIPVYHLSSGALASCSPCWGQSLSRPCVQDRDPSPPPLTQRLVGSFLSGNPFTFIFSSLMLAFLSCFHPYSLMLLISFYLPSKLLTQLHPRCFCHLSVLCKS